MNHTQHLVGVQLGRLQAELVRKLGDKLIQDVLNGIYRRGSGRRVQNVQGPVRRAIIGRDAMASCDSGDVFRHETAAAATTMGQLRDRAMVFWLRHPWNKGVCHNLTCQETEERKKEKTSVWSWCRGDLSRGGPGVNRVGGTVVWKMNPMPRRYVAALLSLREECLMPGMPNIGGEGPAEVER